MKREHDGSDAAERPCPKPRIGGYRSGEPYSAEEVDELLKEGFGDWSADEPDQPPSAGSSRNAS